MVSSCRDSVVRSVSFGNTVINFFIDNVSSGLLLWLFHGIVDVLFGVPLRKFVPS